MGTTNLETVVITVQATDLCQISSTMGYLLGINIATVPESLHMRVPVGSVGRVGRWES